ncbi:MAG: flavodoxin family protein [Desulfobacterales bacterium]|nr:flavodoxin family protein [Desulfobacterales bacterium]
MKTLVIYSSQTSNTKKLAEAVVETLGEDCTLVPVAQAPDPVGYDLVALGFWLQAGKPDPKASAYLEKVGATRLFLFATHGAASESAHAQHAMAHAASLAPSAEILGRFSCQGEVNPKVLEKVRAKNPPPPWIDDAVTAVGHPDTDDLDRLRETLKSCLAGL